MSSVKNSIANSLLRYNNAIVFLAREVNMPTGTKVCKSCGNSFERPKKYSDKQWETKAYCSRECTPVWNKGLTKNDDARMASISEKNKITGKGRPAWNRGLTKETSEIVKSYTEKMKGQKRQKANENQLAGLEKGRRWAQGRSAQNTPAIARSAKIRSAALTGRKNPEHSERMKKLYEENPHLHPNAIIAKKAKGHGFTYIEKIVKELLDELNIKSIFNFNIGSKWVDFAIIDCGLIIEADGEKWHKDAEKEKERDEYLEKLGWKVLHLTGSDIVKQTQTCKQRILSEVEKRRNEQIFSGCFELG